MSAVVCAEDPFDRSRADLALPWKGGRALSLRFSSALEKDYLRDRIHVFLPLQRFSGFALLFLYGSYLLLDYFVMRRLVHPWVYGLILGVSAPAALFAWVATFVPRMYDWIGALILAALYISGAALIIVANLTHLWGDALPSQVLVIYMLYNFFMLGVLFRNSVLVAAATVGTYAMSSTLVGRPTADVLDNVYFLVAAALLGGIGCWLMERTERRAWLQSRLLRELSERDPLTGLFNRRVFFERCELALRQARRDRRQLTVVLLDVDEFKHLNDSYGHPLGDECLRRIAAILAASAARPLDLAARLGGDEFALVWYEQSPDAGLARAEEIRVAVAALQLWRPGALTCAVTVSIGVAAPELQEATTPEQLVARADAALYVAKAAGRNRAHLGLE